MLDFNALFDFSRNHCIAICAFLVPANLVMTLQTLILVGIRRNGTWLNLSIGLAIAFALLMVLHVATWQMIGVIRVPTFVLLMLGTVCLMVNSWALISRRTLSSLLNPQTWRTLLN